MINVLATYSIVIAIVYLMAYVGNFVISHNNNAMLILRSATLVLAGIALTSSFGGFGVNILLSIILFAFSAISIVGTVVNKDYKNLTNDIVIETINIIVGVVLIITR